jgi:prepilin-type N-terminal cleavage/methylation domain-containing protein
MRDKIDKETKSGNTPCIPHGASLILQRRNGFTLLEVLISLAVIGALLVPLIYTLNYHLSLVERQETITTATLLAKNMIVDLAKSPEESKGSFDSPYETYSYETSVKDSPYVGIAEVVVTVRNGKEEVTLNEFVFK